MGNSFPTPWLQVYHFSSTFLFSSFEYLFWFFRLEPCLSFGAQLLHRSYNISDHLLRLSADFKLFLVLKTWTRVFLLGISSPSSWLYNTKGPLQNFWRGSNLFSLFFFFTLGCYEMIACCSKMLWHAPGWYKMFRHALRCSNMFRNVLKAHIQTNAIRFLPERRTKESLVLLSLSVSYKRVRILSIVVRIIAINHNNSVCFYWINTLFVVSYRYDFWEVRL